MMYGEIVQLGPHRLMCGDARKREDIEALLDGENVDLVLTDPPYGARMRAGYDCFKGGWERCRRPERDKARYNAEHFKAIIGDKGDMTAREYWEASQDLTDNHILWGGQYFAHFLPPMKGWLVWYKRQSLWNHSDCELAWTNLHTCIHLYEQLWSGACRSGSCTLNPRPCVHPTQKPVELHARILEDFSAEGDIVLDCFGGSGTTLIACEVTGRRCFMMELSPEYCNVIINRYNTLTEGSITWKHD